MIKITLNKFQKDIDDLTYLLKGKKYKNIYGIPRGGIPLAMELSKRLNIPIIGELKYVSMDNTLIVDDLIDSGKTIKSWIDNGFNCAVLYIKGTPIYSEIIYARQLSKDEWIEFWYEENELPAEDAVIRLIESIGEDINREGLQETPKRVIKAWNYLNAGYKQSPEDLIKTFDSDGYDQMVLLKDIEFFSLCEHHLLTFTGKAHIAYIPDKKVIGVSKLARILNMYARRLQIQERLGEQVTSTLMDHLKPIGAACIIEAQHLCMKSRGVEKQNSMMVTSSLKGVFLEESQKGIASRQELMGLIK